MTAKQFIHAIADGEVDIIQLFLDLIEETKSPYCVIGGLAVNAYVEPLVSLDLDVVVAAQNIQTLADKAQLKGAVVEAFSHSINIHISQSELRIQLQNDLRYQEFLSHCQRMSVLGYEMQVARLEDILQGKIWAYEDRQRRKSKRQKDFVDIIRIIEAYPQLRSQLSPTLLQAIDS